MWNDSCSHPGFYLQNCTIVLLVIPSFRTRTLFTKRCCCWWCLSSTDLSEGQGGHGHTPWLCRKDHSTGVCMNFMFLGLRYVDPPPLCTTLTTPWQQQSDYMLCILHQNNNIAQRASVLLWYFFKEYLNLLLYTVSLVWDTSMLPQHQVTERAFQLTIIHASAIYHISPEFANFCCTQGKLKWYKQQISKRLSCVGFVPNMLWKLSKRFLLWCLSPTFAKENKFAEQHWNG